MENHKRDHQTGGSRLAQKPVKEAKRRSPLTARQKVLAAVAVVLAIVLLGVLAWKSLFIRPDIEKRPDGDPAGSTEQIDYGQGTRPKAGGERKSKDYYTVLILGRDTGGGGNTDTMLLASYDVTNQKASVMSIPRDTMVNVSWDVKKINSVYNVYGGGEKGIQALYKEVAQLVGFEPDFQVVVEWEAVGKLVDAIGGVYFDVPYHMDYHDPYQDLVIEQEKGYRLLNGDDAMQVIRWRKNDKNSPYGSASVGDSGRMEIQQNFLMAVIKQMMQPANVLNIGKIAKVFQDTVETDMSFQNILWFGQQAFSGGLSLENVSFFTMPYKPAFAWSRSYQQNLDYVVPDADALLELVNEHLSPFSEVFTLSDLDIMYVNADGSVGSTTGYVEDSKAAKPPVKPAAKPDEPVVTDPETGEAVDPGTGGVTDPGTGEVTDPGTGGVTDPGTGEVTDPGAGEAVDPGTGEAAEPGGTTDPAPGETTDPESGRSPAPGSEPGAEPPEPDIPDEPDVDAIQPPEAE